MSSVADRKIKTRRLAYDAILLALALILAIVERWIPLALIVPIPGVKLGLANIVTLFALLRLKPADALAILILRCLIIGTITGPVSLMFSLSGGLLAFLFMWLMVIWHNRAFSLIGISVAGAAAHNVGQIMFAVFLMSEPLLIWTYLPLLLLAGTVSGTLTAVAALPLVSRFPRINLKRNSAG
jgi:heptaprenyl diphosphate synthase